MESYEKYKPSGIEWIGEVPEHWERKSFKLATDIIMGQSPSGDDIKDEGNCLFMQGNAEFGEKYPNAVYYCDNCSKHSRVGDILMSVRAPVGELNYSDQVYGIGRGLCSIKPTGVSSGFLWYYLWKSKEDFNAFANGSTFTAITVETLKSFPMVIPSLAEQEAIAAYLDARCADIDKVVATQEKRIALLKELKQSVITQAVTRGLNPDVKMKDSGVEWIGEVPEHWEIKKLKFLVSCNDDVLGEKTPDSTIIKYVEISDVDSTNGVNGYTEYEFKDAPSRARRITKVDDVIVSTVRTYLKAIARIKNENLIVSTGFAVLRAKEIDSDYLAYSSFSQYFIDVVISESVGVSYPAINASQLVNIKIALPEKQEQRVIAKYLNKRCGEIDKQIDAVTKQIELLREYKQSLITEVVTGKRKVC